MDNIEHDQEVRAHRLSVTGSFSSTHRNGRFLKMIMPLVVVAFYNNRGTPLHRSRTACDVLQRVLATTAPSCGLRNEGLSVAVCCCERHLNNANQI